MRKHNYFRSGLALILATSMLGSQVAASELPISSQTASETGGTGAAQEGGFSDGTNSGTGQLSLGSADGDGLFCDVSEDVDFTSTGGTQTEFPSVTAVFNVEEAEEQWNTYEVHAEWTIQNVQEQGVSLALGMDRVTYEGLPEAMMADSEGVCKISSKEGTTIPATLQEDPQNAERVLLTWEQTDNGQVSADFTVSAGEADSLSTITAQWHDADTETWTELAKADLNWKKAPDEEENSSPEENPENGEKPSIGEAEPTVTPEVTPEAEPTPTVSPEPTEETEPTVTPEVTPEAEPTVTPEAEATPTVAPIPELPESDEQNSFDMEIMDSVGELVIPEADFDSNTIEADTSIQGSFIDHITHMEFYQLVNNTWTKVENGNFVGGDNNNSVNGVKSSLEYTLPAGTLHTGADATIDDRSVKFNLSDLHMYSVANQSGVVYEDSEAVGSYSINAATGEVVIVFDEDFAKKNEETPVYGTLRFESKWEKSATGDDTSIKVHYGDQTEITIWPDGIPGDVTAQKTMSSYDYDTGLVTYELKVTSNKGTSSQVVLKDTLTGFISDGDMHVLSVTDQNNHVLQPGNVSSGGYEVSGASPSGVTVTLPEMSANSSYTVLVTAQVPKDKLFNEGISVDNTLTATSTNKNNEDISSTGKVEKTVDNNMFNKSGHQGMVDGKPVIWWEITVNSNKADLAGMTLTDSMLDQAKGLTISPNTGYTHNDGEKTILFNQVNSGANKETYTIKYYTFVTESAEIGKPASQKNTVELNKKDGPSQKKDVTVTYNVKWISKSGSYDSSKSEITWVVTVNEEEQDIAGATLTDTMFNKVSADDLTISPSSGYEVVSGADGKVEKITFLGVNGEKNTTSYTITYKTPVTDADKQGDTAIVTNEGTLEGPGGGTSSTGGIGVNVSEPGINKTGSYDSNNKIINWTVTLNSKFADLSGKTFTDTFNEAEDGKLAGGTVNIFNSNAEWNAFQTITVIVDKNVAPGTSEVTEKNEDGSAKTVAVSDIQGLVNYVNSFWSSGDEKYKECKYEIKYATLVEKLGTSKITNTSTLGNKEAKAEVEVDVKPDKKFDNITSITQDEFDKDKTLTGSNISDIRRIQWNAQIPVLQNGIKAETAYYDYPDNGQWFSVAELAKNATGLTKSITIGNGDNAKRLTQGKEYTLYLTTDGGKEGTEPTWVTWEKAQTSPPDVRYNGFKLVLNEEIDGKYYSETLNFSYTTLVDMSSEDTVKEDSGNIKIKNEMGIVGVDKGGKDDDTTEIKSSFSKNYTGSMNGAGQAQSDGLKWKLDFQVVEAMKGKEIKIVDKLQEGVSVTAKDTVTFELKDLQESVKMIWKESEEGGLVGNAAIVLPDGKYILFRGTYKDGVITITIPPKYSANLPVGDWCSMEYTASEVADSVFETGVVTNTATLSYDESTKEVTNTQPIVKVEPKPEYVKKEIVHTSVTESDRTYIPYRVLINQDAKDLVPKKDVVSMKDTLYHSNWDNRWNFEVELNEQSVKLYYGEMVDGAAIKKQEVPNSLWGFTASTDGKKDAPSHFIDLEIPDETFLILEYTYAVKVETLKHNQETEKPVLTITNEAKLYGESGEIDSSKDEVTREFHESSATAKTNKVTFYKVRKGAVNDVLAGAEFDFYKWDKGTWKKVTHAVSGEDGKLILKDFAYEDGIPYYFVETKAPEGYIRDENHHHFYISDKILTFKDVTCDECGPNMTMDQKQRNTKTYLENEPIPQTKVNVKKEWKGADGSDIEPGAREVRVQLYQVQGAAIPEDNPTVQVKFESDKQEYSKTYSVPDGSYLELVVKNGWGSEYGDMDFGLSVANKLGGLQKPDAVSTTIEGTNGANKVKTYRIAISGDTTISSVVTQCHSIQVVDSKVYCAYQPGAGEGIPYGEPVVLSRTNNWSKSWWTLPQYYIGENDVQYPYSYYVKEISNTEGYLIKYTYLDPVTGKLVSSQTLPSAAAAGDYTITNVKKEVTTVSVEKKWTDPLDGTDSNNWVDLQLFQSTVEQDYTTEFNEKERIVALYDRNNAERAKEGIAYSKAHVTFPRGNDYNGEDLATYLTASNGAECRYVTSKVQDGKTYLIYNIFNIQENGCALAIASNNIGNNSEPFKIEPGLYNDPAKLSPVKDSDGKDVKVRLSATDEWKYSWDNLPKTDADGHELFYYVQETASSVDGQKYTKEVKYTTVDRNKMLVEITNVAPPKKQISVKKQWLNADGTEDTANHDGQNVTVQLYQYVPGMGTGGGEFEHKIRVTYNDGYSSAWIKPSESVMSSRINIWIAFPDYQNETSKEIAEGDLTCTSDSGVTIEYAEYIPKNDPRCPEANTCYKVYNVFGLKDASYTFQYSQYLNSGFCYVYEGTYNSSGSNEGNPEEENLIPVPGEKIVLNAENDWSHTWTGLPYYSGEDELFYYVKEIGVSDDGKYYTADYDTSTDADGNTVVKVKNTPTDEVTEVTATKKWEGYTDADGNEITPNYKVEVQLLQNGTPMVGQTKTLNSENHWTCTWPDLEPKDDSGKPYHYTVEEVSVKDMGTTPPTELSKCYPLVYSSLFPLFFPRIKRVPA